MANSQLCTIDETAMIASNNKWKSVIGTITFCKIVNYSVFGSSTGHPSAVEQLQVFFGFRENRFSNNMDISEPKAICILHDCV